MVFCPWSSAATISNHSSNSAVNFYVAHKMPEEIIGAKPIAESLVGFKLNESFSHLDLQIFDTDNANKENGSQFTYTSIIELDVNPSEINFGALEFRNIL